MEPEILTAEEAAELLRVSPSQIRTLARKGLIPCKRIGGHWRFVRSVLLKWMVEEQAA